MQHLKEIIWVFFKLGLTAFGGPAAHIAMLEEEVVERRKWLDRQHFLDLVGATNLIPGPNSTEMMMHIGMHRGGVLGLIFGGAAFILPAAFLTGLLGWAYVQYGELPAIAPYLAGIKPAVLAIILAAVIKLGKKAVKTWVLGVLGAIVALSTWFGVDEVIAILAGGVFGMLFLTAQQRLLTPSGLIGGGFLLMQTLATQITGYSPARLFGVMLKIGAVLFGSGYVLIAYLEGELVNNLGWLTKQQLLDAVAAGQFTPGPVLTTATFLGYVIDGIPGAVLATLGIFLPSFFLVALLHPFVPKLRNSPWAAAFLDAVNVSAVGIMVTVLVQLAQSTLLEPFTWQGWAIAILAVILTFYTKVHSAWIVIGSAGLGWLLYQLPPL
ncbi:chromate efflux transporter [Pontibacter sp. G13]|uniref:chromate efflux transporter n=1 Tax=Pontibacter sp. G13 TaxID=3074898 RepID=UPI002889311B|nr:chromate efflux transporter [Pontibacter sp. G13]WNJ19997.1 chromate efflux transporter [Pontibacter sp. G13]